MFERFSTASRRVVVEAEAEARRLDHGFIGTEHLALALAGEAAAGSRANDLLIGSGIDADELREAVRATIGAGDAAAAAAAAAAESIPFTPRTKKVLELSLREALSAGRSAIEPEHLLLGLFREGDGVGVLLLRSQLGGVLTRSPRWRPFRPHAIPGLSAGGLRVIAEARRAAGRNPSTVGTQHLLLGILAETDGVAARILERLGVTREAVEAAMADVDVAGTSDAPPSAPEVELGDEVLIKVPDPALTRRLKATGRTPAEIADVVRKALDDLAEGGGTP